MLVARVLRSTRPHANITAIDTSKAEAVPGVRAVITYKDAPKVMIFGSRQYALNDRVRFKGEAVAALAAVDAETADKAMKLIDGSSTNRCRSCSILEEALKPARRNSFRTAISKGSRERSRGATSNRA
jgi:xanthine dehydrogenase molybdopterin-binding subunit B